MAPPAVRAEHANWGVMAAVENFNGGRIENCLLTLPTALTASFDAVMNPAMLGATAFGIRERALTQQVSKTRGRTGMWSNEQLAATVAAVDAGCQIASAAKAIGIPTTSLRDHLYGKTMKRKKGRQGVLTVEEETTLVKWMLEMQDHAHPISILELRRKVAEITQEQWTPFTDGIPGRGWLKWFRNRHPELILRSSQGLEEGCARGLNPSSVASLYENL